MWQWFECFELGPTLQFVGVVVHLWGYKHRENFCGSLEIAAITTFTDCTIMVHYNCCMTQK
jgi:hypothetical protein